MKRFQATLFMSTAYNSLAGGGILMWEKLIRNQFGENRFTEAEKFFYTTKCKNLMYWRISLFLFFICSIDLLSSHLSWLFGKFRECNCLIWPQPHCLPLSASTTKSWRDLPKARLIVLVHGFRFSQSMFASLKVWNVVHWTYFSSQN